MATVIRLKRGGRTHKPFYRIVVMDSRNRTRGQEIEILGVYHPCARPKPISEVDAAKTLKWLRTGAQPSPTAKSVLGKLGILKHFHEGTTPEEAVVQVAGAEVEDKGYNAPPPPKPEEPKKAEAAAEETEASAEGGEAEAAPAEAAEAPAATEDQS